MNDRLIIKRKYEMPLRIYVKMEYKVLRKKFRKFFELKRQHPRGVFVVWKLWCSEFDKNFNRTIENKLMILSTETK